MIRYFLTICLSIGIQLVSIISIGQIEKQPLKIGVIGLTHTHVHWILGREDLGDIELVGIVEPNQDLAERYSQQHGYSMDLVYNSMEELVAEREVEAVLAFGSIYEHLEVVEFFAPLGIHIMVEKPLAVSMEHAIKMKKLADLHGVHLLTNYETTWYSTNWKAYEMVENNKLGVLRKVVVHDGHQGPKEIGVNQEFLDWLTDPVLNGGGALIDFGCYGANLITWLMKGEKPLQVSAITQTNKPEIYPDVDDEATILLQYAGAQGVIQASWNWPFSRKDMEVYGSTGYVISENRNELRYRLENDDKEVSQSLPERPYPDNDPFALFAAVIRGDYELAAYDLSSLENNMIVVEILDAARQSAKTGEIVKLAK